MSKSNSKDDKKKIQEEAVAKAMELAEAQLQKGFEDVKKYMPVPTMTDVITFLNKQEENKVNATRVAQMQAMQTGCGCYPYGEWTDPLGNPISACFACPTFDMMPDCPGPLEPLNCLKNGLPCCGTTCFAFHCKINCCCNCCKSVGKDCGPCHCFFGYFPSCFACLCDDEKMSDGDIIYKKANAPSDVEMSRT